jgi:hypothetical protein
MGRSLRIAVASQNLRTVTGHAGKTHRFLVFAAERGAPPRELERLDLPRELSFRNSPASDRTRWTAWTS